MTNKPHDSTASSVAVKEENSTVVPTTTPQTNQDLNSRKEADELGAAPPSSSNEHIPIYLTGLRFWLITISLAIALFVTNLEIPIVTTSLVAITRDFDNFENVGWIISSYLLGYVGILVIFAKLSDVFGRKLMVCTSVSIFIIASAACGGSQTFVQLAVFRAFQGVGGAGCFALATVMMTEMVPPEKYAKYVANLSAVYALSLLTGPILGGAISSNTTWRWVFIINIPIATPALIALLWAIPHGFPYHGQQHTPRRTLQALKDPNSYRRLDILGAAILLCATLALTAGFQEAGSQFAWNSAYVISLLTISGVLWIALLVWERRVTLKSALCEPVLPWRFFQSREMISLLLNGLFLGGPWFVAIFQLPQRFQLIYGSSGTMAGVQTMPFTFAAPVGTAIASVLVGKFKVPVLFVVLLSGILQTIGFSLMATLPTDGNVPARIYGFQVIAGFGCGINISTLILLVPFVVQSRDKAVGMGAVSQMRIMGGAIVLAIATAVFNNYTNSRLAEYLMKYGLTRDALVSVQGMAVVSAADQGIIRSILAGGFNRQMIVLTAFAAAQIPTSLLLWRKEQIRV